MGISIAKHLRHARTVGSGHDPAKVIVHVACFFPLQSQSLVDRERAKTHDFRGVSEAEAKAVLYVVLPYLAIESVGVSSASSRIPQGGPRGTSHGTVAHPGAGGSFPVASLPKPPESPFSGSARPDIFPFVCVGRLASENPSQKFFRIIIVLVIHLRLVTQIIRIEFVITRIQSLLGHIASVSSVRNPNQVRPQAIRLELATRDGAVRRTIVCRAASRPQNIGALIATGTRWYEKARASQSHRAREARYVGTAVPFLQINKLCRAKLACQWLR